MRDLTWSRDGLLGFKGNLDFGTGRGQRSLNNCSKGKFRLEPPWPPWTGFSKRVSRILLNKWRLAKNLTEGGIFPWLWFWNPSLTPWEHLLVLISIVIY